MPSSHDERHLANACGANTTCEDLIALPCRRFSLLSQTAHSLPRISIGKRVAASRLEFANWSSGFRVIEKQASFEPETCVLNCKSKGVISCPKRNSPQQPRSAWSGRSAHRKHARKLPEQTPRLPR